jgi:hypothetical protein
MNLIRILIIFTFCASMACKQGPKIIESTGQEQVNAVSSTGIFSDAAPQSKNSESGVSSFSDDLHKVKVIEVLPTDKYVYLNVEEEGEDTYWIATRKQEINKGESYFYRGGLLKTQFESKEYNRIFDKIFLVSNIVPANHSSGAVKSSQRQSTSGQTNNATMATSKSALSDAVKEASTSISELVNNKEAYEGQKVQLSGMVTKVNPNIMGRNWIHLKDGSMDNYDLVITSSVAIPEGHEVSLVGIVTLDRDFGAGYSYDLLVENAELVR